MRSPLPPCQTRLIFLPLFAAVSFMLSIRFGAKWQSRSKRHRGEKENRGLGEGGESKNQKKKEREPGQKDGGVERERE